MAQQVLPDQNAGTQRGRVRERDGAHDDDARDGTAQQQRDDDEDQRQRGHHQQGQVAVRPGFCRSTVAGPTPVRCTAVGVSVPSLVASRTAVSICGAGVRRRRSIRGRRRRPADRWRDRRRRSAGPAPPAARDRTVRAAACRSRLRHCPGTACRSPAGSRSAGATVGPMTLSAMRGRRWRPGPAATGRPSCPPRRQPGSARVASADPSVSLSAPLVIGPSCARRRRPVARPGRRRSRSGWPGSSVSTTRNRGAGRGSPTPSSCSSAARAIPARMSSAAAPISPSPAALPCRPSESRPTAVVIDASAVVECPRCRPVGR